MAWLASVYTVPSQSDLFTSAYQKQPVWCHHPTPAWAF